MRYRNKRTGVIVSPASQEAEKTFENHADYEPIKGGKGKNEKLPHAARGRRKN